MNDKREQGNGHTGGPYQQGANVFVVDYSYYDGGNIEYISRVKLPYRPVVGDLLHLNGEKRYVEVSPTNHDLYDYQGEGLWTVVKVEQSRFMPEPRLRASVKPGDLNFTMKWMREIEGEPWENRPSRRRDEKYYMNVLEETLGREELYEILRKVIEEYGKTRGGMDRTREYLTKDDPRWETGFRKRRVNTRFDGDDLILSTHAVDDYISCKVTGLELRKSGDNISVADFVATVREAEKRAY